MATLNQDLYGLQYSADFSIQGLQEADIDLSLPPVSDTAATVYGTVTDGTQPIADAVVKLFDEHGVPFQHTMTNAVGEYVLENVPAGTYTLAAVKEGCRLSDAAGVILQQRDTTRIDLICIADPTLALGTIAGVVNTVDASGVPQPLGGVKLTLQDELGAAVAVTYTIDDGEFVFYDVADGRYTLLSTAEGYLPSAPVTVVIGSGSIANVTMTMLADSRTYNGTVSGTITDRNGRVVAGCFVGLYQVTVEQGIQHETLVAVTKTNASGNYLFGGVSGGNYLVKAKMSIWP